MKTVDNRLPVLMKRIVTCLVTQDFDAGSAYSSGERLSPDQIRRSISDYGRKLVMPPDSAFVDMDVIQVERAPHPTWSVRFDLWTEEEGRSDLTLECTVIDRGGESLDVEIDNLHVL